MPDLPASPAHRDAPLPSAEPISADLVIEAGWIVPVRPRGVVLEGHALVIAGGRILALLPRAEVPLHYRCAARQCLPGHVLLPGLVNAHAHSAMTLLRGAGEDLPLERWLRDCIWPLERALVGPEFVRDGTRLAGLEMLRAGVTTCSDMYFHPVEAALALRELGLRAVVGLLVFDFPSRYASDADDYLRQGLAARDVLQGDPGVGFTLAPHAPYTVGDASLRRIQTLAEELDLPIHMHVHETAAEIAQSVERHGCRPLQRLDALGLVNERLIAVHATQLLREEIALLAARGTSVAHCPLSNAKLASGQAPSGALLAAGVNLAIGTDGAASNNRLELLRDAALGSLMAKAAAGDPTVFPAWQALECATLGGARALGMDTLIGSLEPGKAADLIAMDLDTPETQPVYDVIAQVVHAGGREQFSHAWVQGQPVLAEREPATPGGRAAAIQARQAARHWHARIQASRNLTNS